MAYNDNMVFDEMNNVTSSKADSLMGTDWQKRLSERNISSGDFDKLYKERWGSLDRESYGQLKNQYDPSWYESLEKQDFPSEIMEASMKDAEMYMSEMKSGIDLKETRSAEFTESRFGNGALGALEKKKVPGLKGFFQRLLPGGKSGYGKSNKY